MSSSMTHTKTDEQESKWPVKSSGWLIIEDHCEDGTWSGFATSDDPKGNLHWEENAIPITVGHQNPSPAVVGMRDALEKLRLEVPLKHREVIIKALSEYEKETER